VLGEQYRVGFGGFGAGEGVFGELTELPQRDGARVVGRDDQSVVDHRYLLSAGGEDAQVVELADAAGGLAGEGVAGAHRNPEGRLVQVFCVEVAWRLLVDYAEVEVAFTDHPHLLGAAGFGQC
jgi:hypothetical protein